MVLTNLISSPNHLFWGLMMVVTIATGSLTFFGFFASTWYWFDIIDQFRFQYLVVLIGCILIFCFGGQWLWVFLSLGFFVINFLWMLIIYIRPKGWKKGEAELRIILSNVLRKNRSFEKLIACVERYRPDLIVLVEVDEEWMAALERIRIDYPAWSSEPRDNNYGLALLSRYPIESWQTYELTKKGNPILKTDLRVGDKPISVVVCHPPPPKNNQDLRYRNQEIEQLTAFPLEADQALILCGDFNTSPWSMPFRVLQRVSNMVDSTRGFGFQPSWPTNRFWMRVPIDHCLVTPDIRIINRRIGPNIGSDHYPVIIDLTINHNKEE